MSHAIPEGHALARMLRGLTEHAFLTELGIADVSLIGYVSDLLVRFVPSDAIWKLRDGRGRPIDGVTAMLREAESASDASRKRECHRHVGDYTLFWTGMFPEAVPKLSAGEASSDALLNYRAQGKLSYYVASTYGGESEEAGILRRLSAEFELCAFGLSRVRKEWERSEGDDAPGPLRIIRG